MKEQLIILALLVLIIITIKVSGINEGRNKTAEVLEVISNNKIKVRVGKIFKKEIIAEIRYVKEIQSKKVRAALVSFIEEKILGKTVKLIPYTMNSLWNRIKTRKTIIKYDILFTESNMPIWLIPNNLTNSLSKMLISEGISELDRSDFRGILDKKIFLKLEKIGKEKQQGE